MYFQIFFTVSKIYSVFKVSLIWLFIPRLKPQFINYNVIFMLVYQLLLFFRMVVSLMYYGVTMNSGNIGGNFFLNFFLFACMEYPAYAIAIFFLDKVGRKKLHCACMITGGAACLSTIFTVLFGGECKNLYIINT